MRRFLLAIALLAGAACTDLSGLSSTGADGGAIPTNDAGADADAGGCAGDFCEGFDDPGYAARWTDKVVTAGTAELDTTLASSPPSSLHVKEPPGNGQADTDKTFMLRKYFPAPKSVRCSFSFRSEVALTGVNFYQDFFVLQMSGPGIPDYALRLALEDGRSSLREDVVPCDAGTCPRKVAPLPAMSPLVWRRVELETDFTNVIMRYDGVEVYTGAFVGFTPSTFAIRVGMQNYSTGPADVHIDDLVCRFGK